MTFYFAAGEMCGYVPSDSTTTENTGTSFRNTNFARTAILCGEGSPSQYAQSETLSLPDEFWIHFDVFRGTTFSPPSQRVMTLTAGASEVLRMYSSDSACYVDALIGGVWTTIISSFSVANAAQLQTFDVYVDGNSATGSVKVYVSGTLRGDSGSVDLTSVAGITNHRCYGVNTASGNLLSQVIIADEPTIGMRLATYYPAGAGSTSDWTGDHTLIDEAVLNDADFIYSATNGQIELCTGTGPALTGYVVRAVGVYARAKCGAGGPQNLQFALRANGSNYFSSSKALDVGYEAHGAIWETNPDTTNDWLTSQLAALQFGVKAIT